MSALLPLTIYPNLDRINSPMDSTSVDKAGYAAWLDESSSYTASLPADLDEASHSIGLPKAVEKKLHLLYLMHFRTQQCPMFAYSRCSRHRPFTCFHWHFPNQRRRQPKRLADGTFSYSPDVYCDKYDEVSGECANGDACPYAHRNAGDTERRYHLRYFKTGTCVHDTDADGQCSRNGAHCAFAHSAADLRAPVYDVRECSELPEATMLNLPASLEKDRAVCEEPNWRDMEFTLANYKTRRCRKPPRMCRQGYACPYFHNAKDRRRPPTRFAYRSSPCPTVKKSDEWRDSGLCPAGDSCQHCHTRTEQQFHPEIYKTTRCNDMVRRGHCPRGPFCAFAHNHEEATVGVSFWRSSCIGGVGINSVGISSIDASGVSPESGLGSCRQSPLLACLMATADLNGRGQTEMPQTATARNNDDGDGEGEAWPPAAAAVAAAYGWWETGEEDEEDEENNGLVSPSSGSSSSSSSSSVCGGISNSNSSSSSSISGVSRSQNLPACSPLLPTADGVGPFGNADVDIRRIRRQRERRLRKEREERQLQLEELTSQARRHEREATQASRQARESTEALKRVLADVQGIYTKLQGETDADGLVDGLKRLRVLADSLPTVTDSAISSDESTPTSPADEAVEASGVTKFSFG